MIGRSTGFGDGAEVLKLAFLAGAVVVRVRREDAGKAGEFSQLLSVGDGHCGGVVGASGKDGDAAGGGFDGDLDDAEGLLLVERCSFARRSAGDQEGYAGVDLACDEGAERGLVERAVRKEGGDERGAAAGEVHVE